MEKMMTVGEGGIGSMSCYERDTSEKMNQQIKNSNLLKSFEHVLSYIIEDDWKDDGLRGRRREIYPWEYQTKFHQFFQNRLNAA